ncbi:MAG: hypothetical protein LQ352_004695 [Teloschistes flavicans]|nr:MAG: hypothetical protein LQ352_004695 [Teloschistes flavicans]
MALPTTESTAATTSSQPSSRLFIVCAGAQKREFSITETLLRKSPVLARMCDGEFKRPHTPRIDLPEDNPDHIENIIEFLKTGRLCLAGCPARQYEENRLDHLRWKAGLYLTVVKYGLEEMKHPVVKSCVFKWWDLTLNEWFHLAEDTYAALPADDHWFRWLRNYTDKFAALDKWIEKGGRLATDISLASRRQLVEEYKELTKEVGEVRELKQKIEDLEREVRGPKRQVRDWKRKAGEDFEVGGDEGSKFR